MAEKLWDAYPGLKIKLDRLRADLRVLLRSEDPALAESIDHILSANGKMLRPACTFMAAALAGRGRLRPRIYKLAAAVEIMHMATLVHDDIIDGSGLRRGRPSLNALHGDRMAVLVGDYLFSRCFSLVAGFATLRSARLLASGISAICAGEISQSRRFQPAGLSLRNYLRRITGKTAALFAMSFHVGAAENGAPLEVTTLLRRVGYSVGMAFQIVDDILDFQGDPSEVGKPLGGDLRAGIYTLPVILARRAAVAQGEADWFSGVLSRDRLEAEGGYEEAAALIERFGGFSSARRFSALYTERALRAVRSLPPSVERETLSSVVTELLERRR